MMDTDFDIESESIGYIPVVALKSITDKSKPEDEGRFFSGMLNANEIDAQRERFEPSGIDTKSFMSCGGPILASSHYQEMASNGQSCVVARVLSISRTPTGLRINKAEFDTDPLSEHYKGKVQRGFIKAMSAALIRKAWDYEGKDENQVRVVTKSVLVHGILTSQPVNRGSLIGRKSLDQIDALKRELESLKSGFAPLERFEELADAIKSLSERLEEVWASKATVEASALESAEPTESITEPQDTDLILQATAELAEVAYLAAHPELPDAAFCVELGAEKSDGKVLRKYRHLPHHTSAVKSPTENESVNKALLRNALARVNQVECTKEDSAAFRKRAESHLQAHARAMGIGSKE